MYNYIFYRNYWKVWIKAFWARNGVCSWGGREARWENSNSQFHGMELGWSECMRLFSIGRLVFVSRYDKQYILLQLSSPFFLFSDNLHSFVFNTLSPSLHKSSFIRRHSARFLIYCIFKKSNLKNKFTISTGEKY